MQTESGAEALKKVRRREARYLLRSNLTDADPARLWGFYLQLSEVENAFKELKGAIPRSDPVGL